MLIDAIQVNRLLDAVLDNKLKEFYDDVFELSQSTNFTRNDIWGNQLRGLLQSTNISKIDIQDFEKVFYEMRRGSTQAPYESMKMFIKLLRRKNLETQKKSMDSIEYLTKEYPNLIPNKPQMKYGTARISPPLQESFPKNTSESKTKTKKIFIVHGQDNNSKLVLENMLREMGLEPIILHKQANKGNTILEKFESHADDVNFAFVLFTPDDIGGKINDHETQKSRARQNVILEFGYFLGKLGRRRVCCLYKQGVELPTDMQGLVYVPFSSSPEDNYRQIRQELIAAGYDLKQE